MISYDIVPVLLRVRLRKTLSCVNHYRVAYIAILVIAMLGILLSLTSPTLSPLRAMTNWIYRFYMPIIAAPFILAVLGFRTASHNALIGMATGALAVVAWRKWIYPILLTDSSTFTCILVNGMAILTVHYVWRWSRRTKKLDDDGVETTK